jgi:hypothetical protein
MADEQESKGAVDEELEDDEAASIALTRQVPLGIVFARIVIVTSMSFAAALAIFFLVAGAWPLTLACAALTVVFMFLMFFVERFAEPGRGGSGNPSL